jgi:hypothetical protein
MLVNGLGAVLVNEVEQFDDVILDRLWKALTERR